jgi:hypothetical protein
MDQALPSLISAIAADDSETKLPDQDEEEASITPPGTLKGEWIAYPLQYSSIFTHFSTM